MAAPCFLCKTQQEVFPTQKNTPFVCMQDAQNYKIIFQNKFVHVYITKCREEDKKTTKLITMK